MQLAAGRGKEESAGGTNSQAQERRDGAGRVEQRLLRWQNDLVLAAQQQCCPAHVKLASSVLAARHCEVQAATVCEPLYLMCGVKRVRPLA